MPRVEEPAASARGAPKTRAEAQAHEEPRSWERSEARRPARKFTVAIPLPGGRRARLSTDRVRARPAVSPQLAFILGQNAIGLGVWGLLSPRSINGFLGLKRSAWATRLLFGAREMATGVTLAADPTRREALWARVAGDMFDIAVLSRLARPGEAKRRNAKLALGVVLTVTALDVVAALRMSRVRRTCA